jgi:voltage-gated potassium channel
VRAATYCDLYRLDKESFERVIAKFPEFAAHIGAKSAGRRQGTGGPGPRRPASR